MHMHNNILAVYPELLKRLERINGVKAVKEAGELATLVADIKEKRKIAPLHGAVYVVYGGHSPADTAGKGKFQTTTLYFTIAYCARHTEGGKSTLYETGLVLTSIKRALQGWDAGKEYVSSPFVESSAPAIEYNDGFALYPISFTTSVATTAD